jgi:LuxR family transcriptional regulator
MSSSILTASHPFLAHSSYMKEICKPLFSLTAINHFLYSKLDKAGKWIFLSSSPHWLKHYFDMEYYNTGTFEQTLDHYQSGIYLWHGLHNQVLEDASRHFNIDNGVTFIDKAKDYCEFFHFAAKSNDTFIINFYINQQPMLRHFISFFKERLSCLANKLQGHEIIFPRTTCLSLDEFPLNKSQLNANNHNFAELMHCSNYHLDSVHNNAKLSKREIQCLTWLINGKTSQEIGSILNISYRTVVNHLENIKQKTGCYKLAQLIKLGILLGL